MSANRRHARSRTIRRGTGPLPPRSWFAPPSLRTVTVGTEDEGDITGLYPFGDDMIVFKKWAMYALVSDGSGGFAAEKIHALEST